MLFGYDQGVIANVLVMKDFTERWPIGAWEKGLMSKNISVPPSLKPSAEILAVTSCNAGTWLLAGCNNYRNLR